MKKSLFRSFMAIQNQETKEKKASKVNRERGESWIKEKNN